MALEVDRSLSRLMSIVRQAVFAPVLRGRGSSQRLLTTVLFTDIVGSTERAAALGDRGWKDLVARHHAIVRRELRRFHGRELDTAGDGFFATFERPAQAIECATAISDDLRPLDLQIRAGIHMGEAEVMGGKVGGITVHVAARALAQAAPGEILVTNTVREVTAGADVTFNDRGVHRFKGVPGRWHVYAVQWQPRAVPLAPAAAELGIGAGLRRGPRWRVAAVALVAVVLIAATGYALLPRGTVETPLVAQPDSAVRIDPATGAIEAVVPAGQTPTGIAVGDGTVWVLSRADKLLTGIPVTGGTPRTRGLLGSPTGIAADTDAAWITFGFGASGEAEGILLRVGSGADGQEQRMPVGNGARGVAVAGTDVWVVNDIANSLVRIDQGTRSVIATLQVGDQPVDVTVDEGSVWVAHAVGRTVWRIEATTMRKVAEVSLRDPATAMAVGFGRVWVTSDSGKTVTMIDVPTNTLVATIPLDGAPRGIAAGPDAMWVAAGNAILRIDPVTRAVSRSIDLPGPAEDVAVSGTAVWVTVQR
jgi:YVTN family beta-propeller protein